MSQLPDTDDPFVLLGVAPDATQAAIAEAFAQRAGEFPPSLWPREHAKLRAAFDRVRMLEPGEAVAVRAADPGGMPTIAELVEEGRWRELLADLTRPGRLEEAVQSPTLADEVLPALGALAWRIPDAHLLGVKFQSTQVPPQNAALVARCAHELMVANRFHALGSGLGVPDALVELIGDHMIATPARDAKNLEALRPALADREPLFGICDRIVQLDPWLAATLLERLRPRSRFWGERALDSLPVPVRSELSRRVGEVPDPGLLARRILYATGVLAAFSLYIGSQLAPLLIFPTFIAAGLVIGIDRLQRRAGRRRYDARVRGQLATLLGDLGVQSDCVSITIRSHKPAGRLRVHDKPIRDDIGLALFAAIATLVREHERALPAG